MNISQLTNIAEQFLQSAYQLPLNIPIERNNRLRTTQGRYVIKHDQTPVKIELSGNTLDYGTKEAIIGVLKHECIHYALHKLKKPYKDGTIYFERELKKHAAPTTGTCYIGKTYTFTCNACGQLSETRRKQLTKTPNKYRTTCCKAKLTLVGEKFYNGSDKPITRANSFCMDN